MVHIFNFLSAKLKLTKHYELDGDEIISTPYPNVRDFTSYEEKITSLKELHAKLKDHSAKNHCLVKGHLNKQLENEPRAGSTRSDDTTDWLCLDLDGSPFKTPQEFMTAHKDLADLSYVVQYSASYGITSQDLRCHIFVLLDGKIQAPLIKTWLIAQNINVQQNREALALTKAKGALHYSLDITTCQNDKLLYIAPPTMGKGIRSTLTPSERIQYVVGKIERMPITRLRLDKSTEQIKKEARSLLNALRKAQGLDGLRSDVKIIGEYEVQAKPGEAIITGIREDRGFVYFNLDGGDSWAYYHPVENFDLIHNFKGEPSYNTKELLPGYYKDKKRELTERMGQPTEGGELILAFRDKRTASYWNGVWNPTKKELDLHPANSRDQLADWMLNHGLPPYDVIPIWTLHFNPQSTVIIDEEAKTINTYVPTKWFHEEYKASPLEKAPLIKRIILHVVSGGLEDETFEHFMNWLAVIFQQRIKPKTAWVLHGTEGTGKGLLISRVLAPLLGHRYVVQKRASELEEKFTGWLEQALIAFIDEIQVSASAKKDTISGDLRNFITEDQVTIRNMGRAAVQCDNFTGFIFSSNMDAPVMIKHTDRRYNIGMFQNNRIEISQSEIDEQIPKELPAFMAHIMTRKADRAKAAQCIRNEAHELVIAANRTSLDTVAMQIMNGDIMDLWDSRPDMNLINEIHGVNSSVAHSYYTMIKNEIIQFHTNQGKPNWHTKLTKGMDDKNIVTATSRLSRDQLLVMFEHCVGNMPKTPNKFTRLLKHRKLEVKRIRIDDTVTYGIDVEWKADKKWLSEVFKELSDKTKLRRVK
jgi:hypothetical protein